MSNKQRDNPPTTLHRCNECALLHASINLAQRSLVLCFNNSVLWGPLAFCDDEWQRSFSRVRDDVRTAQLSLSRLSCLH